MGVLKARQRKNRHLLRTLLGLVLCVILFWFLFVSKSSSLEGSFQGLRKPASRHHSPSLLNSLSLTEKQCKNAFPGLTWPIDEIVAEGTFKVKNGGDTGPVQGRIKDGKIYIINAQRRRDLSAEMINSRTAALHQLHRAIITSPEPIPDTIFAINFQDQPFGTSWGYSRAANPTHRAHGPNARSFLMPHFSFWAWRLPFIGSLARAATAITALEARHPTLSSKIPQAIWRGTHWYNSVHNPQLRQKLLAATKNKAWADVQALEWTGGGLDNATNAIAVEDFCRYRYVLHTEGVSYSGRFQFLQMCASVTITPPIQWLQHTTHLVRPLFSSDIPEIGGKTVAAPSANVRKAWPRGYRPEEANIVFVAADWSDLEDVVRWLEGNPKVAQGIARRQRELFVGGGYFSPAAEVCYWRALIRGWNKVVRYDESEWEGKEDVTFEAFMLNNGER